VEHRYRLGDVKNLQAELIKAIQERYQVESALVL